MRKKSDAEIRGDAAKSWEVTHRKVARARAADGLEGGADSVEGEEGWTENLEVRREDKAGTGRQ